MTGNFHFSPLLALISSMTQTIRPPSQTPIKSKMWRIVPSIGMVLNFIPILGTILHILLLIGVWLGGLIVWVMLLIKANKGEKWKLPVIGDFAEKQAGA